MNLLNPPEVFDGGYWYVVPSVPDPVLGGLTPGDIPGVGWCAWYSDGMVVIRTPEAMDGFAESGTDEVNAVLLSAGADYKPYGRIGGL